MYLVQANNTEPGSLGRMIAAYMSGRCMLQQTVLDHVTKDEHRTDHHQALDAFEDAATALIQKASAEENWQWVGNARCNLLLMQWVCPGGSHPTTDDIGTVLDFLDERELAGFQDAKMFLRLLLEGKENPGTAVRTACQELQTTGELTWALSALCLGIYDARSLGQHEEEHTLRGRFTQVVEKRRAQRHFFAQLLAATDARDAQRTATSV